MMEVKTERSKEVLPLLITEKTNRQPVWPGLARQIGNWVTREQKHEHYPTCRARRKTGEDYQQRRRSFQKQSHNKRSNHKHPTEK